MADTEVWVGTWRPHKPIGPIAAMYKSPGPKYELPRTLGKDLEHSSQRVLDAKWRKNYLAQTGAEHHDPRMFKAPAYSFGSLHCPLPSSCSPGPGYHVPPHLTRFGWERTPAYSLHSRPKSPTRFQTPAPGQYSLERAGKSLFPSAPAYSLSPRTKSPPKNRTPGPAEYKLPPILGSHTVTKPSAPSFSLKGRSKIGNFYQDLTKVNQTVPQAPDPSTFKRKAPRYSMTGRNFKPGDKTQKPGPAAHYPEKVTFTRHTAPSFSFGVRHSEFITPLIVKDI
ncbi:outer dense fiber protein 3-like [Scleropages formosus]|uniref:Outer dense fiber protein 3-like n=1 Tax=Scleropages formosus TaxID=113540 RepID=A0A0P7UEG0_SCLFO|nr:outer dense fiber protein 3-like [Scleropages formosus]